MIVIHNDGRLVGLLCISRGSIGLTNRKTHDGVIWDLVLWQREGGRLQFFVSLLCYFSLPSLLSLPTFLLNCHFYFLAYCISCV